MQKLAGQKLQRSSTEMKERGLGTGDKISSFFVLGLSWGFEGGSPEITGVYYIQSAEELCRDRGVDLGSESLCLPSRGAGQLTRNFRPWRRESDGLCICPDLRWVYEYLAVNN